MRAGYITYILTFYRTLPAHVMFLHALPHWLPEPFAARLHLLGPYTGVIGFADTMLVAP